jgi:orotidine-5'-phosphate decarboxylase
VTLEPHDRLIVALDAPDRRAALEIVEDLAGVVSFFKVGLELTLASGLEELIPLLDARVFVDLKLPNDIPETVRRTVAVAAGLGARMLTLSASAAQPTIAAALAGRGAAEYPKLLFVPLLSSQDERDVGATADSTDLDRFLLDTARRGLDAGCDGLIASGPAIALFRTHFPHAVIVSPGIRLAGAATHDHKRSTTPGAAIRAGADYIVVGRPIRDAGSRVARRAMAQTIIDEIALADRSG